MPRGEKLRGFFYKKYVAEQIAVLRESIFWKVKLFFYRDVNPGQFVLIVVEVNYAAVRDFCELLN